MFFLKTLNLQKINIHVSWQNINISRSYKMSGYQSYLYASATADLGRKGLRISESNETNDRQ
jgi:hypothetical protein